MGLNERGQADGRPLVERHRRVELANRTGVVVHVVLEGLGFVGVSQGEQLPRGD
jgi:hypothetical protein